MEEEILDIKRENYRLLKENFDLVRDNVRLQEENKIFERKLREKLCMEAHSQFKELQENSVPKSKIKEKIEEWDKSIKWNNADDRYYAIKVLQELMEDK